MPMSVHRRSSRLWWSTLATVAVLLCTVTTSVQPVRAAGQPRIAIVSEKAFHLEVLAGLVNILKDYANSTTVYLHPLNFQDRQLDFGFVDFVNDFRGKLMGLPSVYVPQFDVLIFISPEYRVPYVREFIDRARPKLVVMMVHNGDAEGLAELTTLHSDIFMLTLSPHVAKFVSQRLNRTVDWMLPLKALVPKQPCQSAQLSSCLSGFAIQGNMDSRRRNYTEIWNQVDHAINSSETLRSDQRLVINVVGSGNPAKLLVPPRLEGRVVPHVNLKFLDFYELIHHNFALIPTLASDAYYDRKFSSTLITSLVTDVPVIVGEKFLQSYSFLGKGHVFMQSENDRTIDVMTKILQLSSEQLQEYRSAIAGLREELNQRALSMLTAMMKKVQLLQ